MEHVLSLSYGKDSLACLGAIEVLGWPLDRIVHAEVWATDTIPADLPPMVEFKAKADEIIKKRWGIEVEHYRAKNCFESGFYRKRGDTGRKTKFSGIMYGWPMLRGQWCLQQLKRPAINAATSSGAVQYIGIASDEPNRFHNLSERKKALWWRLAGTRRIAASGANRTVCCHPFTPRRREAGAGFVTTKGLGSCGFFARITRNCGR